MTICFRIIWLAIFYPLFTCKVCDCQIWILTTYSIFFVPLNNSRWFSSSFQELVTLSSNPSLKLPEISNVGRHLSAMDFHSFLQDAAGMLGFCQLKVQYENSKYQHQILFIFYCCGFSAWERC